MRTMLSRSSWRLRTFHRRCSAPLRHRSIATGSWSPQPWQKPLGEVAKLSTSVPYDVGCPKCGAPTGKKCWLSKSVRALAKVTGQTMYRATPHQERIDHAAEVRAFARKHRKGA